MIGGLEAEEHQLCRLTPRITSRVPRPVAAYRMPAVTVPIQRHSPQPQQWLIGGAHCVLYDVSRGIHLLVTNNRVLPPATAEVTTIANTAIRTTNFLYMSLLIPSGLNSDAHLREPDRSEFGLFRAERNSFSRFVRTPEVSLGPTFIKWRKLLCPAVGKDQARKSEAGNPI